MTYEELIKVYDRHRYDRLNPSRTGLWPVYEAIAAEGLLSLFSFANPGADRFPLSMEFNQVLREPSEGVLSSRVHVYLHEVFDGLSAKCELQVDYGDQEWQSSKDAVPWRVTSNVPGALVGFLRGIPVVWP